MSKQRVQGGSGVEELRGSSVATDEQGASGEDLATALHGPLSVAVCIGVYNQAPYLRPCVESILAQSYPVREIWISDDASTDETPQVVEQLCRQYPQIRAHRQPVNRGIAENLSWVLAQPKTDLVGRIDSDDCYEPRYIEVLASLLAAHPRAGYAHCDIREVDAQGQLRRIRRLSRGVEFESGEQSLRRSASGYRVAANCLLFRASALGEAQYYLPSRSWKSAEDWFLSLRLAALGWGNVYAAQVLASYRVWDDAGQLRFRRKLDEVESLIRIYAETLEPAYEKRRWSTAGLKRNRCNAALNYVDVLDAPQFSDKERRLLETRLRALGDSWRLSLLIRLSNAGLGSWLRFFLRLKLQARDRIKGLLRRSRAGSEKAAPRALASPANKRGRQE
jgi:hypothetical protein